MVLMTLGLYDIHVSVNHSVKVVYHELVVFILSKLPTQAAYRILVRQDSDVLLVGRPWALCSSGQYAKSLFSWRCLHINEAG